MASELQTKITPFKYVKGTYFPLSFGHLEGYSAIYYTYMWSLVIAKDLFSVFKHEGLLNPGPALRYRRAVLEPGGSKPAAKLVEEAVAAGASPAERAEEVLRKMSEEAEDPDDRTVVVLALAWLLLESGVKGHPLLEEARQIIRTGAGLERWEEAGEEALADRRALYDQLAARLG